jgi:hypothetical protein
VPVVSYGPEILTVALGEEHKLRVFEKRTLRRIYEQEKCEI